MNQYVNRLLRVDLPPRQSAFLWGPRKSGKSTCLAQQFKDSIRYDFLKSDLVIRFSARPATFREQILALSSRELARPIILDEVQKVPALLDEVHWLIENRNLRFILCGSSARKLKRGKANLLGGARVHAPDLRTGRWHVSARAHLLQFPPRVLGRGALRLPAVSVYLLGPGVGAHELAAGATAALSVSVVHGLHRCIYASGGPRADNCAP